MGCTYTPPELYSKEQLKELQEKSERVLQEVVEHLPDDIPEGSLRSRWGLGRISVICWDALPNVREVWVDLGLLNEGLLFSYTMDGSPLPAKISE